jgi:SAM-dependent methyltransferase
MGSRPATDVPATTRAHEAAVGINLGCGPLARAGWINCDFRDLPGVDLRCDITRGIALAEDQADFIAAIHFLQDLAYPQIVPALLELRRVLKPGGVLRLAVPDLDKAVRAYLDHDAAYFYVPDQHARSVGAKMVAQIIWYGSVRTPCNFQFVEESLACAGFRDIKRCAFGVTRGKYPVLASLDNRERESLFVEAAK